MGKTIQQNVKENQHNVELYYPTLGCNIPSMEIKERLRKAMDDVKIDQPTLGKKVGVSVTTVQYWLTGRNKPNRKRIQIIASILGVSASWLEFGSESKEKDVKPEEPFPVDKYVFIPRYEAKISAGAGYHNGDHVEISKTHAFRKDWIRKNNWREEDLCVVEASGHSMEPKISDGDVLLVNMADKVLQSGEVYVLSFPGEGIRAKRFHRTADGRVKISSDNPDKAQYPDEFYSPEEAVHLNIVGKVVRREGKV